MPEMPKEPFIVAIDGPAGAGKSSVCRRVCEVFGWPYLSTGLLYRAVAYVALQLQIEPEEIAFSCEQIFTSFEQHIRINAESGTIQYDEKDLTAELFQNNIGEMASAVARNSEVRKRLLPVQRNLAHLLPQGILLDGRDVGTVVFPNAQLKVFLTASLEERTKRRIRQMSPSFYTQEDFENIKQSLAQRDSQDTQRSDAPMKIAKDAILIDTTSLSEDDVVQEIVSLIKSRQT